MLKKNKQGGARKGAGRKPIDDKKIRVPIWIRKSQIKKMGGLKKVQQRCYDVVGC